MTRTFQMQQLRAAVDLLCILSAEQRAEQGDFPDSSPLREDMPGEDLGVDTDSKIGSAEEWFREKMKADV